MEFRHGPRSIAGPNTLITLFVSEAAAEAETVLARELKELGAAICVIANRATPDLRNCSDLLIELALDVPEFARYAVTVISCASSGNSSRCAQGTQP